MTNAVRAQEGYSGFAKALHWAVAACVIFLVPAGIVMANVPDLDALYNLHRSVGTLALALMAMRIGYRLSFGGPAPEPSLTTAMHRASQAAHVALYVLLVAIPVMGWAGASAYGAKIMIFGLFELPPLVAVDPSPDKDYATQLLQIHGLLAFIATAIILIHVSAALYHYFIRRDGVMQRMLP